MTTRTTWRAVVGALLGVGAACCVFATAYSPTVRAAEPDKAQGARHTLDPVCPWGRLADGQGVLVRCLSQEEAQPLLALADRVPAAVEVFVQGVGEAKPDTGSLPEARPQLSKPKDRYVRCVEENGGIQDETAKVTVKFLVRERGRAEGVSVPKYRGVSEAAAKCIAAVVDRRYVGFPEAAFVGATIDIELASRPIE